MSQIISKLYFKRHLNDIIKWKCEKYLTFKTYHKYHKMNEGKRPQGFKI